MITDGPCRKDLTVVLTVKTESHTVNHRMCPSFKSVVFAIYVNNLQKSLNLKDWNTHLALKAAMRSHCGVKSVILNIA